MCLSGRLVSTRLVTDRYQVYCHHIGLSARLASTGLVTDWYQVYLSPHRLVSTRLVNRLVSSVLVATQACPQILVPSRLAIT